MLRRAISPNSRVITPRGSVLAGARGVRRLAPRISGQERRSRARCPGDVGGARRAWFDTALGAGPGGRRPLAPAACLNSRRDPRARLRCRFAPPHTRWRTSDHHTRTRAHRSCRRPPVVACKRPRRPPHRRGSLPCRRSIRSPSKCCPHGHHTPRERDMRADCTKGFQSRTSRCCTHPALECSRSRRDR